MQEGRDSLNGSGNHDETPYRKIKWCSLLSLRWGHGDGSLLLTARSSSTLLPPAVDSYKGKKELPLPFFSSTGGENARSEQKKFLGTQRIVLHLRNANK